MKTYKAALDDLVHGRLDRGRVLVEAYVAEHHCCREDHGGGVGQVAALDVHGDVSCTLFYWGKRLPKNK